MLSSLRLAHDLAVLKIVYVAGLPLGRLTGWHNDRPLPKAAMFVTSSNTEVRVRAETRTLASLDEDEAQRLCRSMYKELVKADAAQARLRERELDRWQAVLDFNPRLRLPITMGQGLHRRERLRKAMAKAARKRAARAVASAKSGTGPAPPLGADGSDSDKEVPRAARGSSGKPVPPTWTRLFGPDGVQHGSVLTRFAQSVWLHEPRATDANQFWPSIQFATATFSENDGWWPHIMWQELYGQ